MDGWPTFSRFGSRNLSKFHRRLKESTPAPTRRAMPAPLWEDIADQLTLLNQPHVAEFIPFLLETHRPPPELLALRKKDLVPPLVPLLSCWSVLIAAGETGVSATTGVRDGSVLMDQRWLPWVKKLLTRLKADNPEEKLWNFDHADRLFGTQRHDNVPTRHSGASIDRGCGFRTLQEVRKRGKWRAIISVARYYKSSRLAPTTTHSLSRAKQAGNTLATLSGIVDGATASPSAHKRMIGKYILDVFDGPCIPAKATNHLGLRGHVFDTKFGPRYDVTDSLVFTRIR